MSQESLEVWSHLYESGCDFVLFQSFTCLFLLLDCASVFWLIGMCFNFILHICLLKTKWCYFPLCSWRSYFSLNFLTWLNLFFLFSELSAVSNFHPFIFSLTYVFIKHVVNTFCVSGSLHLQHVVKMSKMQPRRSLVTEGDLLRLNCTCKVCVEWEWCT